MRINHRVRKNPRPLDQEHYLGLEGEPRGGEDNAADRYEEGDYGDWPPDWWHLPRTDEDEW